MRSDPCHIKLLRWLPLLLPCLLMAQTPVENLQKYKILRERFNLGFVLRAENADVQGSFLPVESRQTSADGSVTAYWADGTWWLGHYVAVLATEYARLRGEGDTLSAEAARLELCQALNAYDRLDRVAESCWNGDTCTNGFYLRDDVPAGWKGVPDVQNVVSDFARHCGNVSSTGNGPSQDQAWASYLGLALVRALVDDSALYAHSGAIARRLVKAMQFTDAGGRESWQVTNPVTGAVMQSSMDIQWLRYAHARACELLTGGTVDFGGSNTPVARMLWNTIQNSFTIDKNGYYNWYGVMLLSTVINETGNLAGDENAGAYEWLLRRSEELAKLRPDFEQSLVFPHLPLASLLLYPQQKQPLSDASVYEQYLNCAPVGGASRQKQGEKWVCTAAPWHTLSLFCPWHNQDEGSFNMLDYLLLYNLYRLVYHKGEPAAVCQGEPVGVSVFPNPTCGSLRVEIPTEIPVAECRLCDLHGRVLLRRQLDEGQTILELSDFPDGIYFLQLSDGKRLFSVRKVIKY